MKPNASAFPTRKSTMPSKMNHGGPIIMKGGDPRARTAHVGGFNRNARMALNPNKKEGGVKLLDITEQPIGMTTFYNDLFLYLVIETVFHPSGIFKMAWKFLQNFTFKDGVIT